MQKLYLTKDQAKELVEQIHEFENATRYINDQSVFNGYCIQYPDPMSEGDEPSMTLELTPLIERVTIGEEQ